MTDKKLQADAMLRSTNPIMVVSDNLERDLKMIDVFSYKPILNSKRPVIVLGVSDAIRETDKCAFLLYSSVEKIKERLLFSPGIPVPTKVLNLSSKKADEVLISRTLQDVVWKRTQEVQKLCDESVRINEEEPPRKELEAGHFPLRIMFISSRFTSVLKYMSRDVAQAFLDLGHKVEFVEEREPWERKTDINIYRKANSFRPHIIWLMDHTRGSIGGPGVFRNTYVCSWIQDDLPHLWSIDGIRSIGPFDFIFSMFPGLSNKMLQSGYQRVYNMPVGINESIFHPGMPREEFKCDIAFPCNIGASATASDKNRLNRRLDPVLWAIEMGLDIKLWGDGWEMFPDISRDRWMGPIENGPDLADVYRSAKYTLHANSDTNLHQRVFEAIGCMSVPLVYGLPHDPVDFAMGTQNMVLSLDNHMIRFSDKTEFQNKILYYLKRDDQRANIAFNAFKYSVTGDSITDTTPVNTYKSRIQDILDDVLNYKPKHSAP